MQLTPRYDGPPVLQFVGPIGDPAVPLLRQRRRLGAIIAGLDESQWATPSRCDKWTVHDVVAHLVGTDQFWTLSAAAALAGAPTRYLATFDPVATPPQMVAATAEQSPAEIVAAFTHAVDGLASALEHVDEQQWSLPAEAPPGHVPLHAMARHALWDGWIHDRDIALPLGLAPVEEPDEVLECLAYAAALSPAFLATAGSTRRGSLAFHVTDPDAYLVVVAGDTVVVGGEAPAGAVLVEGGCVAVIEALSFRGPFPHDVDAADQWLFAGLANVFEVAAGT